MVPRTRLELPTRGFSVPNFWKSENPVITTIWFYSNFSTYFWFRLELFGNIWPWRAQFGHNSIKLCPRLLKPHFLVLNTSLEPKKEHNFEHASLIVRCSPWSDPIPNEKDTPFERSVQPKPAKDSKVIELPRVVGLHHRYEWKVAE